MHLAPYDGGVRMIGDDLTGAPAVHTVAQTTGALLRAMRPRQWTKNILVFAAPATASQLSHASGVERSVAAFVVFVAASSGTYLVNDVLDASADRLHPVKRRRPVAAGELSPTVALTAAVALIAGALAAAFALSAPLGGVVATYVALTLAYSLGVKNVPVIELAFVSAGFVLRAAAGGAATHVALSPWFLIVTSAGALLIVAGKRSSELATLGSESGTHRATLDAYPAAFLRSTRLLAASVAVTAYCLWVFERASRIVPLHHADNLVFFELSAVPFVLALLCVELALESGRGGEPEELALKDRTLQALGLAWVVLVALGIYV